MDKVDLFPWNDGFTMNNVKELFNLFEMERREITGDGSLRYRFKGVYLMKIRLVVIAFTLVSVFASAGVFAQDCAPCVAVSDVTCQSCAPCSSCTGMSCELFGGLRSLLACRPCVSCVTITPECTPVCSVAPVSCDVSIATRGPIVASNIPHVACNSVCTSSQGACSYETVVTPTCCGEMFPYLKPCLYNAVHRPINGVCKLVHGAFTALACATTPVEDCGFFKPAYVSGISCGSCTTCGTVDSAPVPCSSCSVPTVSACNQVSPSCD